MKRVANSIFLAAVFCLANAGGAGAQEFTDWQGVETVLGEEDIAAAQSFIDGPMVPQPMQASSPVEAQPAAAELGYGHVDSNETHRRRSHKHHNPYQASGTGQLPAQSQVPAYYMQGHAYGQAAPSFAGVPVYFTGASGAPAGPYIFPGGTVQPIIIIQQGPPDASFAQQPAAPVVAAPNAAAPVNALPAAQAADPGAKQPLWKNAVNSLAGNAGVIPGNLGKGMSVAAPVLNAILQGL